MREWVRGFALGVRDIASHNGTLDRIRDDIRRTSEVLQSSDSLVDVFSDPSAASDAKLALIRELFASRISKISLELTESVLSEESPRLALETLVQLPGVLGSSYVADDAGYVASRRRVEGYAMAYFRLVSDPGIAQQEEEIYRMSRFVESSRELRRLLSGIGSDDELRRGLVEDLFGAEVSPSVLSIARFAVSTSRVRDVVDLFDRLAARASEERGRGIADVRSAYVLTPEQRTEIVIALSRAVGHELDLRDSVDASLIGGIVAVVGDKIFDGSARHRLDQARNQVSLSTR